FSPVGSGIESGTIGMGEGCGEGLGEGLGKVYVKLQSVIFRHYIKQRISLN
ncbi:hypothetical protein Tco_0280176, partial [Tanacetum coccineum]